MYTPQEKGYIAGKWLLSHFRRDWQLRDYPVRVRRNGTTAGAAPTWMAQIMNWPGPMGLGNTKEEAEQKLADSFITVCRHRGSSPRPGSRVPMRFAETRRVAADPKLRSDFIIRVLGFRHGSPVFISDESSLSDFGNDARVSELRKRITDIYGVDVSDLRHGLLCEIFERIQRKANHSPDPMPPIITAPARQKPRQP